MIATVLLGFAGFATEVGIWYMAREKAYGAVDAAAVAGAIAVAKGEDWNSAALDALTQNGFAQGGSGAGPGATIQAANISSIPTPWPGNSALNAVHVSVNTDFTGGISSLFGTNALTVSAQAVAQVQNQLAVPVCALALSGSLNIMMNLYAEGFYLASNATAANAIAVADPSAPVSDAVSPSGVPSILATGFWASGECANCPDPGTYGFYINSTGTAPTDVSDADTALSGGSVLGRPFAGHQLPTPDPFVVNGASLFSQLSFPATFRCPTAAQGFLTYTDDSGTPIDPPPLDSNNCPVSLAKVTWTGTPVSLPAGAKVVPPSHVDPAAYWLTDACGLEPADETRMYGNTCAYVNMDITIDSPVVLEPGTYMLVNSSITFTANASVYCSTFYYDGSDACVGGFEKNPWPGVTFVLVNPNNNQPQSSGHLWIDPGASVNLYPPQTGVFSTLLNSVLFYRDATNFLAESQTGQPAVVIEDGHPATPSSVQGIMYFPGATAYYAANLSINISTGMETTCSTLIADTVNIGYWSAPGGVLSNPGTPSASTYATLNSAGGFTVLLNGLYAAASCPGSPVYSQFANILFEWQ